LRKIGLLRRSRPGQKRVGNSCKLKKRRGNKLKKKEKLRMGLKLGEIEDPNGRGKGSAAKKNSGGGAGFTQKKEATPKSMAGRLPAEGQVLCKLKERYSGEHLFREGGAALKEGNSRKAAPKEYASILA